MDRKVKVGNEHLVSVRGMMWRSKPLEMCSKVLRQSRAVSGNYSAAVAPNSPRSPLPKSMLFRPSVASLSRFANLRRNMSSSTEPGPMEASIRNKVRATSNSNPFGGQLTPSSPLVDRTIKTNGSDYCERLLATPTPCSHAGRRRWRWRDTLVPPYLKKLSHPLMSSHCPLDFSVEVVSNEFAGKVRGLSLWMTPLSLGRRPLALASDAAPPKGLGLFACM